MAAKANPPSWQPSPGVSGSRDQPWVSRSKEQGVPGGEGTVARTPPAAWPSRYPLGQSSWWQPFSLARPPSSLCVVSRFKQVPARGRLSHVLSASLPPVLIMCLGGEVGLGLHFGVRPKNHRENSVCHLSQGFGHGGFMSGSALVWLYGFLGTSGKRAWASQRPPDLSSSPEEPCGVVRVQAP